MASDGAKKDDASLPEADILKLSSEQVNAFFESKLQVKAGATEEEIFERMCEMELSDLEHLQSQAVDISKAGLDWEAKVRGSVWEVCFANFIS
mmetsp:Transcript_105384/g.183286  ORF Transcript_105384/g.183286 Transcript_105384/m.183286 type:complete len:93 (-) Transcript_105384:116-394(-)